MVFIKMWLHKTGWKSSWFFFFRIKIRHPFHLFVLPHPWKCSSSVGWGLQQPGIVARGGSGWRGYFTQLCVTFVFVLSLILLSAKHGVKTAQTLSLYHGRKKWCSKATAQNMHSFCNLLDNLWYIDHETGRFIIVFSSNKRTKLIWEWDKDYWHIWSK